MDIAETSSSGSATMSRAVLGSPRQHLLDEPLRYVRARASDVRAFVLAGLVASLVTAGLLGWNVALSVSAFAETPNPGTVADVAGVSLIVWTAGSSLVLITFLIASWYRWSDGTAGSPAAALRDAVSRLIPMTASYLLVAFAVGVPAVIALSPVLVTVLADRPIGAVTLATVVVTLLSAGWLFVTRLCRLVFLPLAVIGGVPLGVTVDLLRRVAPREIGPAVAGYLAASVGLVAISATVTAGLWVVPLLGPLLWLVAFLLVLGYPVLVVGSVYARLSRPAGAEN